MWVAEENSFAVEASVAAFTKVEAQLGTCQMLIHDFSVLEHFFHLVKERRW